MLPLHHLYSQLRVYGFKHKALYILSLMVFFYAIFDGLISYIFPLVIEQNGYSKTMLGFILGSSSIVGAGFDFAVSKYMHNTHFRRMYILMFIFCFLAPAILWTAKPIWMFLLVSGIWGIYYDLQNFGSFNFMSKSVPEEEHSGSFGILWIFKSLGCMLAPILAGLAIGELVDWKPFVLIYIILGLCFMFFCVLLYTTHASKLTYHEKNRTKPRNFLTELGLWEKIGKLILPVLSLTLLLNIVDAFFWTIGPILSESYKTLSPFNGLFLTLYELPPLIIGWFIGKITLRYGKKRSAFLSFISGSLLISLLPYMSNAFMILTLIFVSSCFLSIAWPAINGAYADYISETSKYESEIEALQDFFTNIGYIVGPIFAGVIADHLGNEQSFTVIGLVGAIIGFILWKITPKKIEIKIH